MSAPPAVLLATSPVAEKWLEAFKRCKNELDPKEEAIIFAVPSYEHARTSVETMEKLYRGKKVSRVLERISPLLENFKSFSSVIDTAVSANPNPAALIWGGIKLVLELFLRTSGTIDKIIQGFSDIAKALPRFEEYQMLLVSAPRLNEALVDLYELVVRFLIETIKIFRSHPLKNIFLSLWKNTEVVLKGSLDRIRRQSHVVDLESHTAKMSLDITRYDEIKRLISFSRSVPTATLPYFQIPLNQNLSFFGRTKELDLCDQVLTKSCDGNAPSCFALHGIGGVGKSSVALQFAYRQKGHYKVILWFTSDDATKLSRGYAEAAVGLGLHQENASAEEDREAVKRWLGTTEENWLLVFDNVESGDTMIGFIPSTGKGSVLITSRDPESQYALAKEGTKVEPFSADDGHRFLLSQLPAISSSPNNPDGADALISRLGGLPLGIRQMAGFVRETGCSIPDLLTMLDDMDQYKQASAYKGSFARLGYEHTLASAWDVAFSRLDAEALNLLGLFSLLDPDAIQDIIVTHLPATFQHFADMFAPLRMKAEYYRSLGKLRSYGFLDRHSSNNVIVMHRLVQEATLHFIDEHRLLKLYAAAIHLLRQGHPQSQAESDTLFSQWNTCAIYTPHVTRLDRLRKAWELHPPNKGELFDINFNCSWYLLETGAMAKALYLAQRTEILCDTSTDSGRLNVSYLYNTYGVVSLQHKEDEASRDWFQKSLEIRTELLGDSDVNTMAVRGNMMFVLLNEKKYDDVIRTLLPYRDQLTTTLSKLPVRVKAPIYDQLSMAYLNLGQLEDAWTHLEKSMEMSKVDNLPMFSQGSAYDYFVSGNIKMAQGKLQEALGFHNMALNIRQQVLGDHIQTATSCYRVGDLMDRVGDSNSALSLLLQSYKIYSDLDLIGDFSDGGKARSAWRMAVILEGQQRIDEAQLYRKEAEKIRLSRGGEAKLDLSENDYNVLLNHMDT